MGYRALMMMAEQATKLSMSWCEHNLGKKEQNTCKSIIKKKKDALVIGRMQRFLHIEFCGLKWFPSYGHFFDLNLEYRSAAAAAFPENIGQTRGHFRH